ncbi:MAG: class I SAM-dependent methyltransferase [Bacteriovoracia bacterium]
MNIICVSCQNALQNFTCSECKKSYEFNSGVLQTLDQKDPFYEGRFVTTIKTSRGLKSWAQHAINRRLRFITEQLNEYSKKHGTNLKILDLACGGGLELLNKYGEVTGVDLSQKSLEQAAQIYKMAVRADASNLPFCQSSFDVVIASDFFGHIPASGKTAILKETARVLKPGGVTIQYIETKGSNPMQKIAQTKPDLYKIHFIDREGHIGLEPARVVLERFNAMGLTPRHSVGAYRSWLRPPSEISGRMKEYTRFYPWLKWIVGIDSFVCRNSGLRIAATAFEEIISETVDSFFPFEASDGLFLVAVKT